MLLLASMSLLGTSCRDRQQQVTNPWYSGHYHPKYMEIILDNKKGKKVEMQIDHIRQRIYNSTPLPYGTKLDSAYIQVVMSNQLEATLRNVSEETKKAFSSTDTGKVCIKGGKLELTIHRKGLPTLNYDLRIMSYGYDPNKLTWDKKANTTPPGVVNGKIVTRQGKHYYITSSATGQGTLYLADLEHSHFEPQQATLPIGLIPSSLFLDHNGHAWMLDQDGHIHYSTDLLSWEDKSPTGVTVTQILYDQELSSGKPARLSLTGKSTGNGNNTPHIYTGTIDDIRQEKELPTGFPTHDAYVYSYVVSGVQHSYIMGGLQADERPAKLSFFTSDGVNWGKIPYQGASKVPYAGGLYIMRQNGQQIMLVGGAYEDQPVSNRIKVSDDRGITWHALGKTQLPGDDFTPRKNLSGTTIVDQKGIEHIYLLGGILSDGTPSQELWHGYLDAGAGILNSYDK